MPPNSREEVSAVFQLPAPLAVLDVTMSDGAMVHVRRHGKVGGPRLLLSHGNGFAIDGYFPFWRHLLPDCEVIVFDQRNHGWNPRHAGGHTLWQMASDMESVLHAIALNFGERATVGAFHSLSSIVSLLHAKKYRFPWHTLILFDPPLAPPPGHRRHAIARNFELSLRNWARQRRRAFASAGELAADFKSSRRLQRWIPGAAELMAKSVTRPAADGGVELACPPEFESHIYDENANSPVWSILSDNESDFLQQLLVISSDYDAPDVDPPGLVCKALRSDFGIEVVPVREGGHLLQIERPHEVQTIVRERLRARGFDIAPA
jgi:pimeloyl-ACP methyl ester carboxylesterase